MDKWRESYYILFKAGQVSVYKYYQIGAAFASLNFRDIPNPIRLIPYPIKAIYYLYLLGWVIYRISYNPIT